MGMDRDLCVVREFWVVRRRSAWPIALQRRFAPAAVSELRLAVAP